MSQDNYEKNRLIPNDGAWYPSILSGIRTDEDFLRPVCEAFTNSLEAINDLNSENKDGEITIQLFSEKDLNGELKFDRIVVKDNGVGFNDENFRRLLMYKDTRKGHLNKGSGRFQLILSFDHCEYESTFQNESSF